MTRLASSGRAALLALPGAATIYLSFNAGGFFVGATAMTVVALTAVLILRVTLADEPFAGVTPLVVVTAAALALFALWELISFAWSDAPARALLEFDRALAYLLVLVLFGSLTRTPGRLAWVMRAVALAFVVVCVAGLVTRVLPDVWRVRPNVSNERLSYPLTYWNALGLMAAIGVIFCVHLSSSGRERAAVRVAASAVLPALATTLFFTLSRGAIAAGACGLVAYIVLARSLGVVGTLVAVIPASAIAVASAYGAHSLATSHPAASVAAAQGHRVAIVTGACMLGAGLVRALLLALARRLAPRRRPLRLRRLLAAGGLALAVASVIVAVYPLHAPGYIARQYDGFVHGKVPAHRAGRLTDPSNNGRLEEWQVALDGYRQSTIHGTGAGTYRLVWARLRPRQDTVNNAHSLYLETLGELGLVGLGLLIVALGGLLGGVAARIRGSDRAPYAAVFAAGLAWALHAGVDWDWQMPATTVWLFALGGLAIAAPPSAAVVTRPARTTRLLVGLGCVVLLITPTRLAMSQLNLNRSVRAFERGDCRRAIDHALAANSAIATRPEPYEILAWCDVRLGFPALAIHAMKNAISRDPRNWEYAYGLALVRGAARLDPRPAARRALALNPRGALPRRAIREFDTRKPALWQRRALALRLPGSEQ